MRRLLPTVLLALVLTACIPASPPGAFPSDQWIYELGRCEQPHDGYFQGIWWDSEGTYPGGFGVLAAAYDEVRDPTWPARMSQANYATQLEVVRRLFARYGASAWSCSASIPAPY